MSDITEELAKLKALRGSDFVGQLKIISSRHEFHALETDPKIFIAGGENDDDFPYLLNAARKAVDHGYTVYILPNPRDFRTADFIFERKGLFRLYDLKTVHGKNSVDSQLADSIGQTNRVLLNIETNFNPRLLGKAIKRYFEWNNEAVEVLIMKGNKLISVIREDTEGNSYIRNFMMKY